MTSKDFINLRFNPMAKGRMEVEYPELKVVGGDDKTLRYIVMIYSKDSPLIRQEQNINVRKSLAAQLAGFEEQLDEKSLLAIYDCSDEWFLQRVLIYLKTFESSRLWRKIVTNESLYEEYNKRCMEPIKRDVEVKEKDEMGAILIKAKLRQEISEIDNDLDIFYQKLYEVDGQLEKSMKKKGVSPQNIGNVQ